MGKGKGFEQHKIATFLPVPHVITRQTNKSSQATEQQLTPYLDDAHQSRFHHQDALRKDGDGVSEFGNLEEREGG